MATKHRYILVQITAQGALLLTDKQRDTIRYAMVSLAIPWDGVQPADMFQVRLSNDGNQAIYEIVYNDTTTPEDAFYQVAQALKLPPEVLQSVIGYYIFGDAADYATSRDECAAYLQANNELWESKL